MAEVIPAIIPEQFSQIQEEVSKVKELVTKVQVDIGDGLFSKNKTWPYRNDAGEFTQLLNEEIGLPFWEDIDYEFHLMIENPEKVIGDYIHIGVSSLVVHVEKVTDMKSVSELCRGAGVNLVLAILPSTDNAMLEQYEGLYDGIQCMGSDRIGHHGETLNDMVYDKIRTLREKYPDMPIAIDIGVDEHTAEDLVSAGVSVLVSGSAIFESDHIGKTIEWMRNI